MKVEIVDVEADSLSYTIEAGDFEDYELAFDLLLELMSRIDFDPEKISVKRFSNTSHGIEVGPIYNKRKLEKIESLIKVMDLPDLRVFLNN